MLDIPLSLSGQLIAAVVLVAMLALFIYKAVSLAMEAVRLKKEIDAETKRDYEPLLHRLGVSSDETKEGLSVRLVQAGLRDPKAALRFGRLTAICYGAAVGAAILLKITGVGAGRTLFIGVLFVGVAHFLPRMWLNLRIEIRRGEIASALPPTIDLVLLCLEAGLGVEQAFTRVTVEIGPMAPALTEEISLMLNEVTAGVPFQDAMKRMADRIGLQELTLLGRLVAQGAALGASLARTLREYSESSYQRRVLGLEERAGKMSAQTSLPVALCLLPASLLLIAGPSVVIVMQTLGMGE